MRSILPVLVVSFCFFSCASIQDKHDTSLSRTNHFESFKKGFLSGRSIARERSFIPVSRNDLIGKEFVSPDEKSTLVIHADGSWSMDAANFNDFFGATSFSGTNIVVAASSADGENMIGFEPESSGYNVPGFVAILTPEEGAMFRQTSGSKKTPTIWIGLAYGSVNEDKINHLLYYP